MKQIEMNAHKDWREKFFVEIGEKERQLVCDWHSAQEYQNREQKEFLKRTAEAIDFIHHDYAIAAEAPSVSESGCIFYQEKREVLKHMNCFEWEAKALEFSPENGSRMARLHELFLWTAYEVATGKVTLEELCDSDIKNYSVSEGNTCRSFSEYRVPYKVVKMGESFVSCGGGITSEGSKIHMANVSYNCFPTGKVMNGYGVVVLEK